jgi:molybdopterin synthase catalytic subunit
VIEVTDKAISPESVIAKVKSDGNGCAVSYVGLIRNRSNGKPVLSVQYQDLQGEAEATLLEIVGEAICRWQVDNIAVSHRTGTLMVGEINLVVAVGSAHRREGFATCQYIIDQFKQRLPTTKVETYQDGSISVQEAGRRSKHEHGTARSR